jgi:NAD(P) transhydrogenase subunit alpha
VELLVPHVGKSNVVISTALVPGRKAPLLVSEEAVAAMARGSIIVDLAAPNGGNCALTRPGETAVAHGVSILGPLNIAAEMPVDASHMYARTLMATLDEFVKEGAFRIDFEDEIMKGACVAYEGAIVNDRIRSMLENTPRA